MKCLILYFSTILFSTNIYFYDDFGTSSKIIAIASFLPLLKSYDFLSSGYGRGQSSTVFLTRQSSSKLHAFSHIFHSFSLHLNNCAL